MNKSRIVLGERVESSETIGDVYLYRELDPFHGVHREQSQLPVEDIQSDNILEAGSFKEVVGSAAMLIRFSERIEISAESIISDPLQKIPRQVLIMKGHAATLKQAYLLINGLPRFRRFRHQQ